MQIPASRLQLQLLQPVVVNDSLLTGSLMLLLPQPNGFRLIILPACQDLAVNDARVTSFRLTRWNTHSSKSHFGLSQLYSTYYSNFFESKDAAYSSAYFDTYFVTHLLKRIA